VHLLLLDTGDALVGGGKLGDQTKGKVIVAGMNLMGYDAMALGPRELSLGLDLLRQRMDEADFPMLSANVVLSGTGELLAEPYAILEMGDHRIGILGLTRVPGTPKSGFQVLDPQQAVAQYVPEIAEQADTVVLLSSLRFQDALALVDAVPGVDLLVASLPEQLPNQVVHSPDTGTLAVVAEFPAPRHTGRRVGRLLVTVEDDGTLSSESWQSRSMDRQIADDPEMAELLVSYLQQP
jgi:2',3'-cyclic-nucleotide 2'-phosphodiesterase (5'-nucleotidase family)